ncbi:MAG: hypothetical protein HY040_20750 [Planctomycetes bacterium]|nr:hypothetical protein [Planctomycetota bacterium]
MDYKDLVILRNTFAGHALHGLLNGVPHSDGAYPTQADASRDCQLVKRAFEIANTMLAESQKTPIPGGKA